MDIDSLPEKIIKKVRKEYISQRSFNVAHMRKQCLAIVNLVCWVINLDAYYKAKPSIKPKVDAVTAVKAELQELQ